MLRSLLEHAPVKKLTRGVPVLGLLSAAELAMLTRDHLARLDGPQRRRLFELLRKGRGRPGSLDACEHEELSALLALLEPRLLVGSAAERLSPVPIPKRLLFGEQRGGQGSDRPRAADGTGR